MTNITYQVGGSLNTDAPTYAKRKADDQLYQALKNGEFCYVLNSRQMGKSSLLVRTLHQFKAQGYQCTTLDLTRTGSENITPLQWYKGIAAELWRSFNLLGKINLKTWWRDEEEVSLLQRLSLFIENILLVQFPQDKIIIFVDEIDSILGLDFPVDDFFGLIRFCYNQRAINPEYNRLTFAIFGVATPSDLIADKNRTPFNIGMAIDLPGFTFEEAQPLLAGLEASVNNAAPVLREILHWTGGQPFLTQKLCNIVAIISQENDSKVLTIPPGTEAFWVENLVRSRIIDHWQACDEPEHLKTIRDRILRNEQKTSRLLGIYQQILQSEPPLTPPYQGGGQSEPPLLTGTGGISTDDSPEQIELILSGLVVKEQSLLKVKNRIYEQVFNLKWVEKQLGQLRPYSQTFDAWVTSKQQDLSRLLRGQALKDAQSWAQGKSLSDLDYQFLAASEEKDRREVQQALEAERTKEIEARLTEEHKRLVQETKAAKQQRILLFVVSFALMLACGLGITTFFQYRKATASEQQARVSEIKALASSSDGLFASNRKLDALIEAIKAKRKVQKLGGVGADTAGQVDNVLRQAVYEADEFNRLSGHKAAVLGVDISHNSEFIASASVDKTIKLWRRDGTEIATLKGHQAIVRSVKFSPDGEFIASGSDDGTVKLWQRNGTLLKTFQGHTAGIWTVAFSPDGQTIASASADKTVKLWNSDGTLLRTLEGHSAVVSEVVFSPDGKTVASASRDKTVKLWNLDGTELTTFRGHSAAIWGIAWSPDGSFIASGGAENTVKLWQSQNPLRTIISAHKAGIWAIALSADSSTIATGSEDGTTKLWSRQGKLLRTFTGDNAAIYAVALSQDGKLIASGRNDNKVNIWDRNGNAIATLVGHNATVFGLAFSPDGQILASSSQDNTIKLWRPDGTLLHTMTKLNAPVWQVVFSPDGQLIASAGGDGTIKLWQLDGAGTGALPLRTFQGHTAAVWRVAFSPDGKFLASGSGDNTVKIWTVDGKLVRTLEGHAAAVWGVAFSPDGKIIASGSVDNTVKLWKFDGTELTTLRGDSAAVRGVAYSGDGSFVASVSEDNTLILWNVERVLKVDLLGYGCDRARDYLRTNAAVEKGDRLLCD